ncbi:MAG TPA: alcohol dehydrogenase catalytic domain-containing protein [Acidimicrobiales bacterium]|nr:alcohol dehydrogenase catalytic domain-containing protein [Acidimicrobiales bacterium]
MRALVFGEPPDPAEVRPAPVDEEETKLLSLPFGLHEMADARPIRPDWVVVRPRLTGVCGSDVKFILGDLDEGDMDNPMASFSSLPTVPGHEVVADVVELGPAAEGLEVGQRVVLNPWLTCAPRGVEPPCPACAAGELSRCWSFRTGELGDGVHIGVTTKAPGGWAELLSAHDSMLFSVPDGLTDEQAVLADPFAVSFHALLRHPPPPSGRVLLYGAGALGLTGLMTLRTLFPDVEVAVVARFAAQAELARRFGAALVVEPEPREALMEAVADWSGGRLQPALVGLPMAHPGGVDYVYDTVAKPATFEVGARLLKDGGTLVYTGVATPGRWEWTPVYFKELSIVGSNGFGLEDLDGVRRHAIAHYLDLVDRGRVDLTGMVTHRFALEDWWDAVRVLAHQDTSGAVKVAFTPNAA